MNFFFFYIITFGISSTNFIPSPKISSELKCNYSYTLGAKHIKHIKTVSCVAIICTDSQSQGLGLEGYTQETWVSSPASGLPGHSGPLGHPSTDTS